MLLKIESRKKLAILLLFLICIIFSHGQDTLVRRKYLDSLKNELASYTVASYQYLNWYDRSQEELRKINQRYAVGQQQFTYVLELKRKQNIGFGIGLLSVMLLSFTAVIMFSKTP